LQPGRRALDTAAEKTPWFGVTRHPRTLLPWVGRNRVAAGQQTGLGTAVRVSPKLGIIYWLATALRQLLTGSTIKTGDRLLRQLRRVGSRVWCGAPTTYCDKEDLR
ncbi:MAG: hypothetical protein WAV53_16125, partial [Anaerolineae bacterium]